MLDETATGTTRVNATAGMTYDGEMLDEVTVTATRELSLWEHLKQGATWAAAIMILAAAGWIVYRIAKR